MSSQGIANAQRQASPCGGPGFFKEQEKTGMRKQIPGAPAPAAAHRHHHGRQWALGQKARPSAQIWAPEGAKTFRKIVEYCGQDRAAVSDGLRFFHRKLEAAEGRSGCHHAAAGAVCGRGRLHTRRKPRMCAPACRGSQRAQPDPAAEAGTHPEAGEDRTGLMSMWPSTMAAATRLRMRPAASRSR